jgi:hypothetical protein
LFGLGEGVIPPPFLTRIKMKIERELTNEEAVNLYSAVLSIQSSEVDKRTSDGEHIVEVIALPAKTSHKISRQISWLKEFYESYMELVKKEAKEANELYASDEFKASGDKRSPQQIFEESIDVYKKEKELFLVLEKPLKYSDDESKSDFGKVKLKSVVLNLAPDGFIEWLE